jgi:hypothetical protein
VSINFISFHDVTELRLRMLALSTPADAALIADFAE